jgi:Zn-finger nucleic acid-binding protein
LKVPQFRERCSEFLVWRRHDTRAFVAFLLNDVVLFLLNDVGPFLLNNAAPFLLNDVMDRLDEDLVRWEHARAYSRRMRCPRCDHELDGKPAKCDQCNGCWVTTSDLARTIRTTKPTWTANGTSTITCPECYVPLEKMMIGEVHVDRCAEHGVWFDIGEITDVLRTHGKLGPNDVAREDKPSKGSQAAEGAAGVGAGILEVVGTIFDIVT